jgi:hypothetical protein
MDNVLYVFDGAKEFYKVKISNATWMSLIKGTLYAEEKKTL